MRQGRIKQYHTYRHSQLSSLAPVLSVAQLAQNVRSGCPPNYKSNNINYKFYQMSVKQNSVAQQARVEKQLITSQTIFKYVSVAVTLVLLFCIEGFLNFREHCQQRGYHVLSLGSLFWSLAGFFGIFLAKYSWFYFMKSRVESIIHSKYEADQRNHKTNFVLKLSFDSIFYTLVTIFAYHLFSSEYWFPTIAGGCGSCSQIYKEYPSWPVHSTAKLEMYFMIQLGIHSFSLFQMLVIKRNSERKFYEYVLHHSVAVSLILFSTMSNQIAAGTMILITHDASDIMMAFARGYIETKYSVKWVCNLCYVLMTLGWIWMRIIVYPFCLLAQVYANRPTPKDIWAMISFEYGYLLTMAFVLYGMHLFWTFFILKIGIKSMSSKAKSFENIHDKKIKH